MNLNDVKVIIEQTKIMLDDLVSEQKIDDTESLCIMPVVIENVLKNNSVTGEYNE